jgi:rSAM/selenodomain-associated transferase 1
MKTFRLLDPSRPTSIPRGLCALALMTKAPRAGQVKTRLVPPLTSNAAAELNKCFLRDTADEISSATTDNYASAIAVYTPIGTESAYDDILPGNFSLLPQRGADFGERLRFATEDLFRCGFDSVCLIDSDSPTVPAKNFSKAIELLKTHSDCIVLGPCDDGGYYLIGLKKPHRELFEQIDWSTDRVFDQTVRRTREIGLEVKLLPSGYDVDDAASLQRLRDELLGQNACYNVAPHTREFLASLITTKKL